MSNILNVEMKAKCGNPKKIMEILSNLNADFKGVDHQIDTYFNCSNGRLKLRQGNIENTLIHYHRDNHKGIKESHVILERLKPENCIGQILEKAYGIKVVVDKKRAIYFIENVKFHVDEVEGLGSFTEIEAIDENGNIGFEKLNEQCQHYIELFGLTNEDMISHSYSDLILEKIKGVSND
ncbi:MAG: class IV adenylate cyclase [Halobacteriovoraceae bacterium]|nr:class IV adenylate cyclase [Halobacteriovoraceae bacterium]